MSEIETPIVRMLEAYKAAVWAKDVEAFVALYDRDVRVFDAWGKWSYEGSAAWRGVVAEWFGSLGMDRVAVEFDAVQTLVGEAVATVNAFVSYKGVSAAGAELRAMHNRLTWTLRRQGDAWKISHEHTSAPADFETTKVILER